MVWLLVPIVVLCLFWAVMAYTIALRYTNIANDRSLFDSTLTLAGQIKIMDGRVTVDLPRAALNMLELDPYDKVYYEIRGPNEELVSGQEGLPRPTVEEIAANQPIYYDGIFLDRKIRVAALFLPLNGNMSNGLIRVQVAETLVKRNVLAREIFISFIVSQVFMIVVAGSLVWYGVGRGLVSLELLHEEIENRSHLDLSPVKGKKAPREVLSLIHAINNLLLRLSKALAAHDRFIASAAHQLRTPLAGLKTQAELALRQTDPEELRLTLKHVLANSEKNIHLVNQLLSLARAQPGREGAFSFAPFDLVSLAREVARDWVRHALDKDIDLGFDATAEKAVIRGDAVLLKELLNNLVDNAVRYTQTGGRVTVAVHSLPECVVLSVEDNGPGIADEERERVFERFYRVLGTDTDGCGLGLAIVREIAESHGAKVELAKRDGVPGVLIEVRFKPES